MDPIAKIEIKPIAGVVNVKFVSGAVHCAENGEWQDGKPSSAVLSQIKHALALVPTATRRKPAKPKGK